MNLSISDTWTYLSLTHRPIYLWPMNLSISDWPMNLSISGPWTYLSLTHEPIYLWHMNLSISDWPTNLSISDTWTYLSLAYKPISDTLTYLWLTYEPTYIWLIYKHYRSLAEPFHEPTIFRWPMNRSVSHNYFPIILLVSGCPVE